ncbi:MAG: hypothetical protein K1Y36_20920 [Blastocatellia bacterium]|nr:hypothetical protein [Blastocatellia bacterium]
MKLRPSGFSQFGTLQISAFTPVRSGLLACGVLGGLILAVFGRSCQYALLEFDSARYILEDHATHTVAWENVWHIFRTYYFINYNPLHRLSNMLDYALWGPDPAGFRSTNFLLHWIAATFVFLFIRDLTKRLSLAWLTALVFALHPSRVESVVWLAQRKDVLSAAFGFICLWSYLKVWKQPETAPVLEFQDLSLITPSTETVSVRQFNLIWYLSCVFLYWCALASKAQWVPLVMIFLAVDWYIRPGFSLKQIGTYLPFVLLSVLFAWYAIDSQLIVGKKGAGVVVAWWEHIAIPLDAIGFYTVHTFWPVHLCPRYPEIPPDPLLVTTGVLVLLIFSFGSLKKWKGRRMTAFGCAWFLSFLAPMLNLVPGSLVPADRYLYVSIIGLMLPLGWVLTEWRLQRWIGPALFVMGMMVVGTWKYVPVWATDYSVWRTVVAYNPNNPIGLASLVVEQTKLRMFDEAQKTFQLGLSQPRHMAPLYAAGAKLAQATGQDEGAVFRAGLERYPHSADLKGLYGQFWLRKGDLFQAEHWLEESYATLHTQDVAVDLARTKLRQKLPDQGVVFIFQSLQSDPFAASSWLLMGDLQMQLNHSTEARQAYEVSAKLNENLALPCIRLGLLNARLENWEMAEVWLQEARRRAGGHQLGKGELELFASVLARQGKLFFAQVIQAEARQSGVGT